MKDLIKNTLSSHRSDVSSHWSEEFCTGHQLVQMDKLDQKWSFIFIAFMGLFAVSDWGLHASSSLIINRCYSHHSLPGHVSVCGAPRNGHLILYNVHLACWSLLYLACLHQKASKVFNRAHCKSARTDMFRVLQHATLLRLLIIRSTLLPSIDSLLKLSWKRAAANFFSSWKVNMRGENFFFQANSCWDIVSTEFNSNLILPRLCCILKVDLHSRFCHLFWWLCMNNIFFLRKLIFNHE